MEHVRRLLRIAGTIEPLVHDIELLHGSRVVDNHVQINLTVFGSVLRTFLGDPTFRGSHDDLAELFRWDNDRGYNIKHPRWDGQQRYVFQLWGGGTVQKELEKIVKIALTYWSGKVAGAQWA